MRINAYSFAQLTKLLMKGLYTCQELAQETGLHYVTVLNYTKELHKIGAIYIKEYEKDCRGRDIIRIYKLGRGEDAKRQKMSGAERQQRTRNKKRSVQMQEVLQGKGSFIQSANGRYRFEKKEAA